MSSCIMKTQDSDEEVDLETLRLAALKSRKPKYHRVNHNNLIPIVPVPVEPDDLKTKIKVEKISPPREVNIKVENEPKKEIKENEKEKSSNSSDIPLENDTQMDDILKMDDKEEEDSLERLMDQLEAEISGQDAIPANNTFGDKSKSEKAVKDIEKENGDDEIELVQVKTGREPNAIIEIRESASPDPVTKETKKSLSPRSPRSFSKRSQSRLRSRTRSPFVRGRSFRRSRSPYWSRSPRRSRSPYRRSRSPYWSSRWTRSKSRSPFRRYRSPIRKRSPFSRYTRSRSISYGRRSLSPRRRSKSPFYEGLPPRSRNFDSPGRLRRSFSPRRSSKSPRRRSRSPRRYFRNSPYRRSKSPYKRSRSPFKKTSMRRTPSPFLRRSKSPSPKRSPIGKRCSKSPGRRPSPKSAGKLSPKPRSKSPAKTLRRSPGRITESPNRRRNRSPLKAVEKNKLDDNEKLRDRGRNERRHRSLSRDNKTRDRPPYRGKYFRRFSPSRKRRSPDKQKKRSKSPKPKDPSENIEEALKPTEKEPTPPPAEPLDPILEARKKKFETLGVVDPTVDKKISLKAIKESVDNPEDDEDALTINVESNLWDDTDESEEDFESRFKSEGARKNRGTNNRTTLSLRNLGDASNQNINKPLEEIRKFKNNKNETWGQGRRNERNDRRRRNNDRRSEERIRNDKKNPPINKSDRKPIVWSSRLEQKRVVNHKENEVSTTHSERNVDKTRTSDRAVSEKIVKNDLNETDDFDKLISDFEKELESDICLSTIEVDSTAIPEKEEVKKPRISVKKDLFEPKPELVEKKPTPRIVKLSDANKVDKSCEIKKSTNNFDVTESTEISEQVDDGPEDYIEDDDFDFEMPTEKKQKNKEEDSQSDLRAVLSKRRNQRITKVVSLQENVPTRLVQSAFQGIGNKKSKRHVREAQETAEYSSIDKGKGVEGRRVLLLHREKNPVLSLKCTVPEVTPDTTIHQSFDREKPRRKRKLHRQLDLMEDLEQEEEDQERFEIEEEKRFRRFRLKRNVTLGSQGWAVCKIVSVGLTIHYRLQKYQLTNDKPKLFQIFNLAKSSPQKVDL